MANGNSQQQSKAWIDPEICNEMLTKELSFTCAVDGSEPAMVGLHYLTEGIMQQNPRTTCLVTHVFDDTRDDSGLHFRHKPDNIKRTVEGKLLSSLPQNRYRTSWVGKAGSPTGTHVCRQAGEAKSSFIIMGFRGRKGKKDRGLVGSNCQFALQHGAASVIIIKDEDDEMLPIGRPAKYVVSVSLNKASTKAFLDALRLSKPGDEIHVVYVKSFAERTESDYTRELKEKYSSFFVGLQDSESDASIATLAFSKYHDRQVGFVTLKKQLRESTAQAVVRYGDEIGADFMVVGTNSLRVQRGKRPIGSVSLDICMEWERNFIVSHWVDISPKLYDRYATAGLA